MTESLKKKTLKGVSWSLIDNLLNSGTAFLVGIVLARILSPKEFGIIGMTTIFIAISNTIIDSGFSNALIRKKSVSQIDYDTVFYFNLLVSIVLFFILYFTSSSIGIFFNEPLLIPILQVLGCIFIINALSIIHRTILTKKIDFKTQTKISFISSLSSAFIGIGMALLGYGVWSIVGQQIIRQFFNTCFLWVYTSWRPTWGFSRKSFIELFGFGSKLLLSSLIDTLYRNIYYVIIGRFYNSSSLGQYTRAEQFNSVFSSNLTSVVQRVSFPILSTIQDDPDRLKTAYRKIIKYTMLITFFCMLGLAAIAKPLVFILIGEKWFEAVTFLQILCFSGMLYPLHAINLNILQVKGRSDLFLKLEIIKKIIAVIPIFVGIFYGIKIMLWGGVLVSVIAFFLNSHYSAKLIGYSTKAQLYDIFPFFAVSFIISLIMWLFNFLHISIYIIISLQFFTGFILLTIIYEFLKNKEYLEVKKIILSKIIIQ